MENARQSNNDTDHYKDESIILVRWGPPSEPYLKLNSDGSSKGNPGPSSYGGLLRDHRGEWICGYMGNIGQDTSLEAEIWGIVRGFCLIRRKNLTKVVVETDCLEAFRLITFGEDFLSHPRRIAIEYCKALMVRHECYMIHIEREGNHCADHMAKLGGKQREELCFLEKPPQTLAPFLLADQAGQFYERPRKR